LAKTLIFGQSQYLLHYPILYIHVLEVLWVRWLNHLITKIPMLHYSVSHLFFQG